MNPAIVACSIIGLMSGVAVLMVRHLYGHRCNWEITGAREMTRVYQQWGVVVDPDHGQPVTVVLERCTLCNDVRTRTLVGDWTVAQLKGEK